jgi:hypothetical protein
MKTSAWPRELPLHPIRHFIDTNASRQIGENERSLSAHLSRIPLHDLE